MVEGVGEGGTDCRYTATLANADLEKFKQVRLITPLLWQLVFTVLPLSLSPSIPRFPLPKVTSIKRERIIYTGE